MGHKKSIFSGLIEAFLRGNLAILLIIVSLAAGAAALIVTPREEEPQIVVPLADVMVMYPGGSAEEVEQLVSSRLERLLYQIDGVEYVYSMSPPRHGRRHRPLLRRRGPRGEPDQDLQQDLPEHRQGTTPGIAGWVVKPIEIDDVPIVNVTLYSDRATTRTDSVAWPRRSAETSGRSGTPAHHDSRRPAAALSHV